MLQNTSIINSFSYKLWIEIIFKSCIGEYETAKTTYYVDGGDNKQDWHLCRLAASSSDDKSQKSMDKDAKFI